MLNITASLLAALTGAPAAQDTTHWFFCVAAMPPAKMDYVTDVYLQTSPDPGSMFYGATGERQLAAMLDKRHIEHETPSCFLSSSREEATKARTDAIAHWRSQGFTVQEMGPLK